MENKPPAAKDLRIGNIVLLDGLETIVETVEATGINYQKHWEDIEWDYAYDDPKQINSLYKTMFGLPLCDAILQRCGFTKKGTHYFTLPESAMSFRLELSQYTSNLGIYFSLVTNRFDVRDRISVSRNFKYLHELQNIMWDLLHYELPILPVVPAKELPPQPEGRLKSACTLQPSVIDAVKKSICSPTKLPGQ